MRRWLHFLHLRLELDAAFSRYPGDSTEAAVVTGSVESNIGRPELRPDRWPENLKAASPQSA
jgi:hypothetical protein